MQGEACATESEERGAVGARHRFAIWRETSSVVQRGVRAVGERGGGVGRARARGRRERERKGGGLVGEKA